VGGHRRDRVPGPTDLAVPALQLPTSQADGWAAEPKLDGFLNVTRIKALKRQMYGRATFDHHLRRRVLLST
jgi:hypothetical protein